MLNSPATWTRNKAREKALALSRGRRDDGAAGTSRTTRSPCDVSTSLAVSPNGWDVKLFQKYIESLFAKQQRLMYKIRVHEHIYARIRTILYDYTARHRRSVTLEREFKSEELTPA